MWSLCRELTAICNVINIHGHKYPLGVGECPVAFFGGRRCTAPPHIQIWSFPFKFEAFMIIIYHQCSDDQRGSTSDLPPQQPQRY